MNALYAILFVFILVAFLQVIHAVRLERRREELEAVKCRLEAAEELVAESKREFLALRASLRPPKRLVNQSTRAR